MERNFSIRRAIFPCNKDYDSYIDDLVHKMVSEYGKEIDCVLMHGRSSSFVSKESKAMLNKINLVILTDGDLVLKNVNPNFKVYTSASSTVDYLKCKDTTIVGSFNIILYMGEKLAMGLNF